ncbi:hypothetical protein [Streptomyces rubellomurinus]|uniref:Uncharacterized protein n=1 Tax=Streptomyces rubellomurinus (strain ATCC 31215) TaxID=359131 RepID=A0A0F2TJV9_STRR3|nr:hypothetical protein [Streptomyces rubellomurinus]KJS61997.1 hypothetical protein VM95_11710 [Streptomyces rubellomurinus]
MGAGQGARRRERQMESPRSYRVNLAYNEAELTIVREAAKREGMAVSAWAARKALAVAKDQLVPVSADAREVLEELIRSRGELVRLGESAGVGGGGAGSVARFVEEAVRRVDRATLQLMRERAARW